MIACVSGSPKRRLSNRNFRSLRSNHEPKIQKSWMIPAHPPAIPKLSAGRHHVLCSLQLRRQQTMHPDTAPFRQYSAPHRRHRPAYSPAPAPSQSLASRPSTRCKTVPVPASPPRARSAVPASPNSPRTMARSMNSSASAREEVTRTPLPAQSPSALITTGHSTPPSPALASAAESNAPYIFAVGIECRAKNSLA